MPDRYPLSDAAPEHPSHLAWYVVFFHVLRDGGRSVDTGKNYHGHDGLRARW